jgi:hypothetical protein
MFMDYHVLSDVLAGIGESYMACKDAPHIPTMPIRASMAISPWYGFYTSIDDYRAR